jgi:hypothetical protein
MIQSENTTVNVILSLLPGFLALFIIGRIADIGNIKEFDSIFFGLILTLVCWALAWPFLLGWAKVTKKTVVWNPANPSFMTGMAALSILVRIGIGIGIQNDVFYVILRSISGTNVVNLRSSKNPLPFLLSQNWAGKLDVDGDARPSGQVPYAWVRIKVKESGAPLVYEGWPDFFRNGAELSEVYLSPACQVDLHSAPPHVVTKIKGPGVLVYEKEIASVEFINPNESSCWKRWYKTDTASGPDVKTTSAHSLEVLRSMRLDLIDLRKSADQQR